MAGSSAGSDVKTKFAVLVNLEACQETQVALCWLPRGWVYGRISWGHVAVNHWSYARDDVIKVEHNNFLVPSNEHHQSREVYRLAQQPCSPNCFNIPIRQHDDRTHIYGLHCSRRPYFTELRVPPECTPDSAPWSNASGRRQGQS